MLLITGLLIGGITTLFLIEKVFRNEYKTFKLFIKDRIIEKIDKRELLYSNCSLPKIENIPRDSTIIIGHAYGKKTETILKTDQMEISNNVKNFLLKNKSKIKKTIFTGDVFNKPSRRKWDILYDSFERYFQIIITPGNHDIGGASEGIKFSTAQNELYEEYIGKKQQIEMPFLLKDQGFNLIIDDSNNKKNSLKEVVSILEMNKIKNHLIILRHHSNIGEDNKVYSPNSFDRNALKKLKVLKTFIQEKLYKYGEIFIIYGDSTNTYCYKHGNITHIWNGIGSNENDEIIILKEGNIYLYNLKSVTN